MATSVAANSNFSQFDRNRVHAALMKTPTGDNLREISWRWDDVDNSLCLTIDPKKARHTLNQNHFASYLALGCALSAIEVSAASMGFATVIPKAINFADLESGSFKVFFSNSGNTTRLNSLSQLSGALAHRSTYRKVFSASAPCGLPSGPTPIGNPVYFADPTGAAREEFIEFLGKAGMFMWDSQSVRKDFFASVRFFSGAPLADQPRLPSSHLGVSLGEQFVLYAFSKVPVAMNLLLKLGIFRIFFQKASMKTLHIAGFFLVCAESLNPEAIVNAGRSTFETWLRLETLGFKCQPVSMPVFGPAYREIGVLPKAYNFDYESFFGRPSAKMLQKIFGASPADKPVWLFRYGKVNS